MKETNKTKLAGKKSYDWAMADLTLKIKIIVLITSTPLIY